MKKIFTPLAFLFFSLVASAQQDPQFSQFMFNKLYSNAGYAGSSDAICGSLLYRNQWLGFDGAPKTGMLSADMPVPVLHGGVGLSVAFDQLGFGQSLGAKLAYSFRLNVGPGKLGIGVDAGFLQSGIQGSKFIATQSGDANIPGDVGAILPDFGFGLYYNIDKKLYFGLSSTHLSQGTFKYASIQQNQVRHYYITGGYNIDLNPSFTLKPSVLIKSDAASTIVDFNTNLMYENQIWGGVSYRSAPNFVNNDAIIVLLGMDLSAYVEGLKFGYSYDITTSSIRNYSSGSHEIMLGYCMKPKPKPTHSIRTVRFL